MGYWLFKTEPVCFSIDHLAKLPNSTSSWDGVRNYQSRNQLRDNIKIGDGVFFYHSSCELIGIAGICRVVRGGYPDHTAWDSNNMHFDPKSTKERPVWYMVDVKFERKFQAVVPLEILRTLPGLENMMVTKRGARLSIQPVTTEEWDVVCAYEQSLLVT